MSATETPAAPAEAPKGPVVELIPLGQNLARVVLTISNQGSLARFQQELQTLGQHPVASSSSSSASRSPSPPSSATP